MLRFSLRHLRGDDPRVLTGQRRRPRSRKVENGAQRENIAPNIALAAGRLFRREVMLGTQLERDLKEDLVLDLFRQPQVQ